LKYSLLLVFVLALLTAFSGCEKADGTMGSSTGPDMPNENTGESSSSASNGTSSVVTFEGDIACDFTAFSSVCYGPGVYDESTCEGASGIARQSCPSGETEVCETMGFSIYLYTDDFSCADKQF